MRAERRNAYWLLSLDDAQVKSDAWRRDYNEHRPRGPSPNGARFFVTAGLP
ncbi:integrase core domain-containing protein [Sphingomonas sp. NFR15]|uniref:integrase core domain-containing protein n=1 Tax=Sphingomonas TaxID=13687 RepID=UPI000B8149D4